jgi:hypothetical protein
MTHCATQHRAARVLAALAAAWAIAGGGTAMALTVTATEVERFTVYHSPDTPGYTCWAGTWLMPDGTLMVSFHQARGPLTGRPLAPKWAQAFLDWPPAGHTTAYDMTGTIQETVHLASTDGGRTWRQVGAQLYHSPMNGCSCNGEAALADGTVLRAVIGQYLPFYDVPRTGFVQRSEDGGATFLPPEPIMAAEDSMTYPVRLRVLRDGRVAVCGAFIPMAPDAGGREDWMAVMQPAMWLSSDGGHTFGEPVIVLPHQEGITNTEECDFAELADGSLLFVERTDQPERRRWQSLLAPDGEGFRVESFGPCPIAPTGCPEMLFAREGVALHIASSDIRWTADRGATWTDLGIGGTGYYPRSVQLPDGRIFCVFHRGSDDPYDGSVDQEIQAMTFRLSVAE